MRPGLMTCSYVWRSGGVPGVPGGLLAPRKRNKTPTALAGGRAGDQGAACGGAAVAVLRVGVTDLAVRARDAGFAFRAVVADSAAAPGSAARGLAVRYLRRLGWDDLGRRQRDSPTRLARTPGSGLVGGHRRLCGFCIVASQIGLAWPETRRRKTAGLLVQVHRRRPQTEGSSAHVASS